MMYCFKIVGSGWEQLLGAMNVDAGRAAGCWFRIGQRLHMLVLLGPCGWFRGGPYGGKNNLSNLVFSVW
jgi:hypothetical protein